MMNSDSPPYRLETIQSSLLAILDAHDPVDDKEERDMGRIREIVLTSDRPLHRENLPGHITGSALVIDPSRRMVLLHYHKSLDGWLQFGGHFDDGEIDPAGVAMREAQEESGIADLSFYPNRHAPEPVDIDVHQIPARGSMPEHLHLDFRYLLATADHNPPAGRAGESDQFRWLSLDALVTGRTVIKTDLHRLFIKVRGLLDGA